MFKSHLLALLSLLISATFVSAHGHVLKWTVNGADKPGFNPSNAKLLGATANRPTDNGDQGFTDWTKGIVACGGASAGTGVLTWDVDAGSEVVAHWDQWPESHKGSIDEYMAKCPGTTCDGVAADSLDWFKIDQANYDPATKKWPTEIVTATKAWAFKIPADIAPGPYLIRHALLAMHTTGQPQVYPVCIQANIVGSGSAAPEDTVRFPAAYDINPGFKTWDLYAGDQSAFVPPGPAVYGAGSGGGGGGGAPPVIVPSSSKAPVATTAVTKPTVVTAIDASSAGPVASSSAAAGPVNPPVVKSSSGAGAGTSVGSAPASTKNGNPPAVTSAPPTSDSPDKYTSCMREMNKCKDQANALPNAQVAAAFALCDSQVAACTGSKKREVVGRYARRSLRFV